MAYELRDLSDIVQRVVDELKLDDNNARELERIRRDINDIYRNEVIPYHRWTWLTGHTDVEHKPYYGSGTVSVTPDSTTIEFSVAPSTSKAGFYFATDSFNEVYTIDSHEAGETTATLTTVYTGSLNDEATFKVWTDRVTLPTDLRETTEVWHDFSRFPMEGVGLQELRRKIADGGRTTQRPAYYSTTEYYGEDEDDRYRVLRIYPALYENSTTLHIDYVKEADSLELEGDEPIMPLEDRIVLVYGALSRAWRRARNPEEAATAQALFDRKLDRMKGKVEDSQDKPQLIASSTYLAGKRRRAQRSTGSPSMGGSSYSSPSYVKQATIEGGTVTANMSVNSGVTIDGRDISADGAELDNHIDATVGAHSASAISTDAIAGLSSDTVQGNLAELANMAQGFVTEQTLQDEVDAIDAAIDAIEADVATRALDSDLTAHIDDTTDAHDASAVSVVPVGNLAATDAQSALVELQDDIDTRIPLSQKGAANGVAELDASGLIPTSQIPALALVDVNVVADTTERDALTVQEGDLAFVTSEGKSYVYNGSGWTLLNTDTAVNTHNALTTGIHGVTGHIVGTTDAQTLTNKDIDGGTASNTNRITLPKNTKTNLDGLTRKEATIVYATDQAKAYVDTGSTLVALLTGAATNLTVSSQSTTYTVSISDDVLLVSAASAWTLTLPTAVGNIGKVFRFVRTDATTNAITIDGNASETIDGVTTYNLTGQHNFIAIVSDGSNWRKIAAGETVAVRYTTASGTLTNVTNNLITFGTKVTDTHGAWNGTTFTAPISGRYAVKSKNAIVQSSVSALTTYATIYKNGASYSRGTRISLAASTARSGDWVSVEAYDEIHLLAGETASIYVYCDNGADRSLGTSAIDNYVTINRVGNY